jgi:hypothetical protein
MEVVQVALQEDTKTAVWLVRPLLRASDPDAGNVKVALATVGLLTLGSRNPVKRKK